MAAGSNDLEYAWQCAHQICIRQAASLPTMESECGARLEALRRDGADCSECACWAIKQLSSVPQPQPTVPDGGHPAGASAEVRVLRAQVAHALSNAGTAAVLEVLVTAALQSVAQAPPLPTLQAQQAAPARSAAPLFHTVTQQVLGLTEEPDAAPPLYALAHLGTLWPREVAGALVEAVASAGARLPNAAGALPARARSPGTSRRGLQQRFEAGEAAPTLLRARGSCGRAGAGRRRGGAPGGGGRADGGAGGRAPGARAARRRPGRRPDAVRAAGARAALAGLRSGAPALRLLPRLSGSSVAALTHTLVPCFLVCVKIGALPAH